MISRLSALAATVSVSVAAAAALTPSAQAQAPVAVKAVRAVKIVELPRVVVVARRTDRVAP